MAAEGIPPPLEDMTATLEQARKLRQLKLGAVDPSSNTCSNTTQVKTDQAPRDQSQVTSSSAAAAAAAASHQTQPNSAPVPQMVNSARFTASVKSDSGDFGGMKKGFLFGGTKSAGVSGNQQSKAASRKNGTEINKTGSSPQADSIPFLKPKMQDKHSDLKLDEVQKAMESTKGFLQDKEWVTDDLLAKVQNNDTLSKRLADPRFMQAVTEFQTDPKAAMMKYQSHPEMQQFLREFCGILGEHFSSLGDEQDARKPSSQTQTASSTTRASPRITELTDEDRSPPTLNSSASTVPVDPHVQQILADPGNREILMDPKIQQLIQHLRSSPEKAQRMLHDGDTDFRQKVDRLISLGLLKLQT